MEEFLELASISQRLFVYNVINYVQSRQKRRFFPIMPQDLFGKSFAESQQAYFA
ncbi:MAG: hypothetical protein LBJ12_03565 [Oscillospiraceae bacterium]|nr:hypothetical protein [Oscillospiraceae bacterium]